MEDYLLTPQEAATMLGVSKVTLNKYIKQGLECVDTTSHRKVPKHAISLWKDPVYAIKMQMLFQEKKLQNQSNEERLVEIYEEIMEFQKKYKATNYEEAFFGVNIEELDDPADYYEWRDLEEEKEKITNQLIQKDSQKPYKN